MNFKIANGILIWTDGSCKPAEDEHLMMWEKIEALQAEVERLKSNESVPACIWTEDQEGNWDTKCGDKHYLTAGTPFENSMHWCCYCGGSLLEELYGEQAND